MSSPGAQPQPVTSEPERRAYHHGNLRAELLACAAELLEQSGPDELSLRQLARLTGVSHAAPHRHFADKQALLDALAESGFLLLGDELRSRLDHAHGSFADQLAVFARTWVGFAVRRPGLLELMFSRKNRAGADDLRRVASRAFEAPTEMIRAARARGEVVDDHDRAAMAIFASLQGLAALVISGMSGDRPTDRLVDETVAVLAKGLRPE